jgi:hypothetical protein
MCVVAWDTGADCIDVATTNQPGRDKSVDMERNYAFNVVRLADGIVDVCLFGRAVDVVHTQNCEYSYP